MKDLKGLSAPEPSQRWMRLRVRLLGAIFFALLCAVFARAVELQIFDRERLESMARDQYVREIEMPARRGDIFDRRGVPLAQSVEVDSIWVDPSLLDDPAQMARILAKKLNLDAKELAERMERGRRFAWVKRQARPEDVAFVRSLKSRAFGFAKEPRRFYPQRELAAHVLGLAGMDGHGLEGLELAFDDELTGEVSRIDGFRDARGRKLLTQGAINPIDRQGASVTLTIDRGLQYVTEKALSRAVVEAKGVAGMAVVLDPKTGELLALANYPGFNPNTPKDTDHHQLRNRAALDTFEPGSTFKSFVVAAALEEGVIRPDDIFYCEQGAWTVGRHTIHDSHPHEWLTPKKVLQVSSNICAAKIALKLGAANLAKYYAAFGFGQRAGLALPGEGKGTVPYPRADIYVATQAFGQGLTATAVQLAAAYGALANGGVLMRPYLVSKVTDPDGVVLLENRPTPVRRVISARTAKTVVSMLESVVENGGTAPRARMDAYRVAGKTGTAQKADPVAGGYSDKRIASFIGMVPAEDPRAVILVVVDEPKTDVYGGLVAAPAFKEIAEAAMPYLGVTPSRPVAAGPEATAVSVNPKSAAARRASSSGPSVAVPAVAVAALTENAPAGDVRVPDLSGKAGREAIARLLAASLEPRVEGSGRVVSQSPPAGTWVARGAKVRLDMEPRP
ncbi:MAG: transpeptidase family protein [Myxococcaceae bacterium]|nr:transpeptidase family protein [Myxococcaceae bacterium]